MSQSETSTFPLTMLTDDEKDELLRLVDQTAEISSIFLKETHEQWEDEFAVALDVGDVVALRSMCETRMAQANEAAGVLLAGPRATLDLDNLDELFRDESGGAT